jgi:hypothetical protein
LSHIVVTDASTWDPDNVTMATVTTPTGVMDRMADNPLTGLSTAYDESTMLQQMVSALNISTTNCQANVAYIGAKNRHTQVTAEEVARKF